ncbi:hypothetical protein Tco_1485797 [Tanacetum coccineum]
MSANNNFSLHDDASLDGSVPASNKGDAPAKPPQIITTNTLSNIKLHVLQQKWELKESESTKDHSQTFFIGPWLMPKRSGQPSRHGLVFQKLLSQLDALGAGVSDEDANHKFLRSLPPAWDSLAMTMRTKKNMPMAH